MRIVRRSIFAAVLAVVCAVSASAAARDGEARAAFADEAANGVFVQADNDERWGGERRGWRRRDADVERGGAMQARFVPLEVILGNVARMYPGHHIGVEGPFERGGRWVYRIKWLTPDGHVLFIFADAETGQIFGPRGGR